VNSQLSQAVDRLTAATAEIEELQQLVKELQKAAPAKPEDRNILLIETQGLLC
jgi:hypothetical protein